MLSGEEGEGWCDDLSHLVDLPIAKGGVIG